MPRIGFFSSSERARHYPWHRITIEGDGIIRWAANEEREERGEATHTLARRRRAEIAFRSSRIINLEQRMDAGRMAGGGDHASEMTAMAHSINATRV